MSLTSSQLAAHSFRTQTLRPPSPDFQIKIENYIWKVHIDVFAGKSDFFRALCGNSFKEGQERSVTLYDDRPALIARLILWVYYGSYKVYRKEEVEGLTVNDLLNSGAHEFARAAIHTPPSKAAISAETEDAVMSELPGQHANPVAGKIAGASAANLASTSMAELKTPKKKGNQLAIEQHWNMYQLADKYGCPELRLQTIKAMFDVDRQELGSIWYIVGFVNRTSVAVQDIQQEMIGFFKTHRASFLADPRFEELVKTTPELAWALISENGHASGNRSFPQIILRS